MKKYFIYLHIAIFLAGFTGIIGRYISLNEALLVIYRLGISALTMWILYSLTGKLQKISLSDIIRLSGIGLLAGLHWVGFFGAVKYANVSVALVCFSSVGFFTALVEPLLTKSRLNGTDLLLGLLVMAGIYIIFQFDPRYKTGIIMGVISAMLLAFVMIFIRQFVQRINPETLLTWQLSGGLITLLLCLPLYLHFFPATHSWPVKADWLWLLALSWFCSVLAFRLSAIALKKLSAFTVNLLYNLEPVYGILLAFIFFGENRELGPSFYAGMSLILMAVLLQMWRVKEKRAA